MPRGLKHLVKSRQGHIVGPLDNPVVGDGILIQGHKSLADGIDEARVGIAFVLGQDGRVGRKAFEACVCRVKMELARRRSDACEQSYMIQLHIIEKIFPHMCEEKGKESHQPPYINT